MTRRLGCWVWCSLLAVGGLSCAASASTSHAPTTEPTTTTATTSPPATSAAAGVSVKPHSGHPRTTFTVSFLAPDTTGTVGSQQRSYDVSAMLSTSPSGCVSTISATAAPAKQGARVRVKLNPATQGGKWCSGRFEGKVTELGRPVCPPQQACPALIVLIRTLGKFSFRVRRPH